VAILAAAPGLFAGPTCANCHPEEAAKHAKTRMAHAAMPVAASAFAENLPDHFLSEPDGGYQFTYSQGKGGLIVTASRGLDLRQGLIRWVIGAGAQGQTPLVSEGRTIRESRVSYFPQLHQYGITVGQDAGASRDAEDALGLKQSERDARSCLACHTTKIDEQRLEPAVAGVQCERCHPGAAQHAAGHGMPMNPGKLSAKAQVEFCGTCHRVKPPVGDNEPENIRFQPLRLMKSRCFASGHLACTTCHVAHEDARRNDNAYYNAKCQTCHAGTTAHADSRRSGDCVGCHMPRVQLHPALTFTDHYIRVATAASLARSR
jgi:hypothetical protein